MSVCHRTIGLAPTDFDGIQVGRGIWANLATRALQGVARNQTGPSAQCQPWALMSSSEKVVTTFQTVNALSPPAAVPIALDDDGRWEVKTHRPPRRTRPAPRRAPEGRGSRRWRRRGAGRST